MTKQFRTPPIGGEDACPECNIEISTVSQVPVGFITCPHCKKRLRFVCVVPSSVRMWLFDANCFPEPLSEELRRARVTSGTFNGLEGYVLGEDTTAQEVVVALEIFGRPAPIIIERVAIEYV